MLVSMYLEYIRIIYTTIQIYMIDTYIYIYDVDIVGMYTFFIHFIKHILGYKSHDVCEICLAPQKNLR